MTLDELIFNLHRLRQTIGINCPVFVCGWNNTGIVVAKCPRISNVRTTGNIEDGEALRIYEESKIGMSCIIIPN